MLRKFKENRFEISCGLLLLLLLISISPDVFKSMYPKVSDPQNLTFMEDYFPKKYIYSSTFHYILWIVTGIVFGIYLNHLFNEYRGFFRALIKGDFFKGRKLFNELSFVRKSSASEYNRKEFSILLKKIGGINKPEKRIQFLYEHVCVDSVIKASKLIKKKDFKKSIATDIYDHFKDKEIDIILSSSTQANDVLSSAIASKFQKPQYQYSLSPDGEVGLHIAKDLRSIKMDKKDTINILIIESTMLTPKIVYKLIDLIKVIGDESDKIFIVNGLCVVFNNSKKHKSLREVIQKKYINLFELDQNMLPINECTNCYLNKCSKLEGIGKSYVKPLL